MLFYLTSRVVSAVAAFLYPGYASYKTLSQRPASEDDLERWLMYWSVLGCVVGVEYVAEWLVAWIPFYYPIKTLFLLYLALPQTRGSSYLYVNHLQPFFHLHESQIDATLASLKVRVYSFLQERLRALWDNVTHAITQQHQAALSPPTGVTDANAASPPTLGDPVSGPAQLISGLWRSYGPGIIASGAALLRQSAAAAGASTNQALISPANSPGRPAPPRHESSTQSVQERKRQLEAELAFLSAAEQNAAAAVHVSLPPLPIPPASTSYSSSRASSNSSIRERGTGKFEEIDVPSDVEGYDVAGSEMKGIDRDLNDSHDPAARPEPRKRTSWFAWGGATAQNKGEYERVKTD